MKRLSPLRAILLFLVIFIWCTFTLVGCANHIAENYIARKFSPPFQGEPQTCVVRPYDIEDMGATLETIITHKDNIARYTWLGYSVYAADGVNMGHLKKHARQVGADTVYLLQSRRAYTKKANIPLVLPDERQTITTSKSGSSSIFGQPGALGTPSKIADIYHNETGTITLPQTYTTYLVPYTERYYYHVVLFYKPKK